MTQITERKRDKRDVQLPPDTLLTLKVIIYRKDIINYQADGRAFVSRCLCVRAGMRPHTDLDETTRDVDCSSQNSADLADLIYLPLIRMKVNKVDQEIKGKTREKK